MTELGFGLLALGLAAATTYVFCVRPMRRNHRQGCTSAGNSEQAQLAALRRELAELRQHASPAVRLGPKGTTK